MIFKNLKKIKKEELNVEKRDWTLDKDFKAEKHWM